MIWQRDEKELQEQMRKLIKDANTVSLKIGHNQGILIKGGFLLDPTEKEINPYLRETVFGRRFEEGREYFIPNPEKIGRWERDDENMKSFFTMYSFLEYIEYLPQLIDLGLDVENAINILEVSAISKGPILEKENKEKVDETTETKADFLLRLMLSSERISMIGKDLADVLTVALGSRLFHGCSVKYHCQEILLQTGKKVYGDMYLEKRMLAQLKKIPTHLRARVLNYDLRKALHTGGHDFQKGFTTMYFLEHYPELMELIDDGHKQHTFPFLNYLDGLHFNNRKMLEMIKKGKIIQVL